MLWSTKNPQRVNTEKIIFYEILIILLKFLLVSTLSNFVYALAQKLVWISKGHVTCKSFKKTKFKNFQTKKSIKMEFRIKEHLLRIIRKRHFFLSGTKMSGEHYKNDSLQGIDSDPKEERGGQK